MQIKLLTSIFFDFIANVDELHAIAAPHEMYINEADRYIFTIDKCVQNIHKQV